MQSTFPNTLYKEIVELKQQIELDESNYKYAVELQKDSQALIRIKEKIRHLKERLDALLNAAQ